jgi:hypothetical protein
MLGMTEVACIVEAPRWRKPFKLGQFAPLSASGRTPSIETKIVIAISFLTIQVRRTCSGVKQNKNR